MALARKYLVVTPCLYQGDCLVVMPEQVADHSVDLVLADLPYGTTQNKWDVIIPLKPLWAEYRRVLKPGGAVVLTASQPFTTTLISSNKTGFRYCWYWHKVTRPTGYLNAKKRPLRFIEEVVVFYDEQPTYIPKMVPGGFHKSGGPTTGSSNYGQVKGKESISDFRYPTDILYFHRDDRKNRKGSNHPTQKPVSLMEYLIKTYTHEGATVLDNTMGSGTTGVACVRTKRNFIGIEKNTDYFELAKLRIATVALTGVTSNPLPKKPGGFKWRK